MQQPFMEFSHAHKDLDQDSFVSIEGEKIQEIKNDAEEKHDILFRNVVFDYQSSLGKIS